MSEGRRDQRGRFWAKIPGIPAHKKVPEPQNVHGIFVSAGNDMRFLLEQPEQPEKIGVIRQKTAESSG